MHCFAYICLWFDLGYESKREGERCLKCTLTREKEIKISATAKNVIDGNIKMYLKLHHIDFLWSFFLPYDIKLIAFCDSFLYYCLPSRCWRDDHRYYQTQQKYFLELTIFKRIKRFMNVHFKWKHLVINGMNAML